MKTQDYWKYKKCFEFRDDEVGDIWVSARRDVVEWVIGDGTECIRRFVFRPGEVVCCGFTTFENIPEKSLVVVLRDQAHVYLLDDNKTKALMTTGESITVCFPFPVRNAFMYRNGVVLERDLQLDTGPSAAAAGPSATTQFDIEPMLTKQKYITLSDPMAPFGTLFFTNDDDTILAASASKNKRKRISEYQDAKRVPSAQTPLELYVKKKRRKDSPLELPVQTDCPSAGKQAYNDDDGEDVNGGLAQKPENRDNLKMVLFPRDSDHNIAVLFDPQRFSLHFYFTKITDNDKSKLERSVRDSNNIIASAGHLAKKFDSLYDSSNNNNNNISSSNNNNHSNNDSNGGLFFPSFNTQGKRYLQADSRLPSLSTNHSNNLRKLSLVNRSRISSLMSPVAEMVMRSPVNNILEYDLGLNPTSSVPSSSKRSASATLDRMGSTHNDLIQTNLNAGLMIPSLNTGNESMELFSKDIVLTQISTIDLPQSLMPKDPKDKNNTVECFSLRYRDKEGIIIVDPAKRYCKLWTIDLIPEVLNSSTFQVYGDSPQNLIQLKTLSQINWEGIVDVFPVENNNNRCFNGCIALLLDNEVKVVNPFLDLFTPFFLSNETDGCPCVSKQSLIVNEFSRDYYRGITNCIPDIHSAMMQHIFQALGVICSDKFFQAFVFQWYYVLGKLCHTSSAPVNKEFLAFESTLLSLIKTSEHPRNFHENIDLQLKDALDKLEVENVLPKIVMGLHLIREEFLLDVYKKKDADVLGYLVKFLTTILKWPTVWSDYYSDYPLNDEYLSLLTQFSSTNVENYVKPLDEPTSILRSLSSLNCDNSSQIVPFIEFSRLVEMDSDVDICVTPRTYKITRLYEILNTGELTHTQLLKILTEFKIDRKELESYPPGILLPLKKALNVIQNNYSHIDPTLNVDIISRADISKYVNILNGANLGKTINLHSEKTRRSSKDTPGIIGQTSSKTMLSILSDVILSAGYSSNANSSILGDTEQSEDMDEGSSLKKNSELIFSEDKRFNEVLSLLSFSKIQNVPFVTKEKEYTKILNQKKRFAEIFALRSCTQGIGWGAVVYSTEKPLSTQKWLINPINFCVSFPDKTKIKVQKEQVKKELLEWGEFHSGVSSGLKISKKTRGINGSWIVFNKPKEVNASHAGFLLGLGLNGHLKNLEEWHIYNYLSLKNTYIGIGLLLGMSSSMKGTMDLTLTKILSIHVAALLPKGANDLNIDIKVQTAGLISLGQLFLKSRHKKMTSVLLEQLSSLVFINEELVADEGYRMAAGVAIGLINLGAGSSLSESLENPDTNIDMDEYDSDSYFIPPEDNDVNAYQSLSNKLLEFICQYHDTELDWLPQNSQIGACIAITLMFLRSGNQKIADQLAAKNDDLNGQCNCRPELIMYREFAYKMIMWDTIEDSLEFIMKDLCLETIGDMTSNHLPIYYAMAGRILSLGIKYASTGRESLKTIFLALIDKLVRFYQYPGKNTVDFKLVILAINVLVNTLLVATSMVMCARGDLDVFRRLRYFHEIITGKDSCQYDYVSNNDDMDTKSSKGDDQSVNLTEIGLDINNLAPGEDAVDEDLGIPNESHNDSENHYSKFLATSMSMGFLFLGSGQYALKNNDLESLAYLILAVLPTFLPPYPLQELKHFWSMAVEPRCLLVKNAQTDEPVSDVEIVLTSEIPYTTNYEIQTLKTPCLLPDISRIKSISVVSGEYYPLELLFTEEYPAAKYFINGTILYVQPRNYTSNSLNGVSHSKPFGSMDIEFSLKKKISSKTEDNNEVSFSSLLLENLGLDSNALYETKNEFEDISHGKEAMNNNLSLIYKSKIQPAEIDDELSVWWSLHDAQS